MIRAIFISAFVAVTMCLGCGGGDRRQTSNVYYMPRVQDILARHPKIDMVIDSIKGRCLISIYCRNDQADTVNIVVRRCIENRVTCAAVGPGNESANETLLYDLDDESVAATFLMLHSMVMRGYCHVRPDYISNANPPFIECTIAVDENGSRNAVYLDGGTAQMDALISQLGTWEDRRQSDETIQDWELASSFLAAKNAIGPEAVLVEFAIDSFDELCEVWFEGIKTAEHENTQSH